MFVGVICQHRPSFRINKLTQKQTEKYDNKNKEKTNKEVENLCFFAYQSPTHTRCKGFNWNFRMRMSSDKGEEMEPLWRFACSAVMALRRGILNYTKQQQQQLSFTILQAAGKIFGSFYCHLACDGWLGLLCGMPEGGRSLRLLLLLLLGR